MSPRANRVMPLGVALGVAVAGMLTMALSPPALPGGPANPGGGFVLLSMEQAAMFRGTQNYGRCTGTATYGDCSGTSASCSDYGYSNCSFARSYSNNTIRYCTGWAPSGPPGACDFIKVMRCYTEYTCVFDGLEGRCKPWGWGSVIERNDDVCTTPTPVPVPPPPQPEPG